MKVTDAIYWYSKDNPVSNVLGRGFSANVFVIDQIEELWMIDVGISHLGRPQRIIQEMKKDGLNPQNITKIFLTHAHPDHCNALNFFQQINNAEIILHQGDKTLLEGGIDFFWEQEHLAARGLDKEFFPAPLNLVKWFSNYSIGKMQPMVATEYIQDNAFFKGARCHLQAIHTPGHTTGHISYYIPQEKCIFLGDLIDPSFDHKASLNLPSTDYDAIYRSIQRLKALDLEWIGAGHAKIIGQGSVYAKELIHGTIAKLDYAKTRTIELLKAKPGIRIREFYGKFPKATWLLQDQVCVPFSVLKSLERTNQVKFENGGFYYTGP